MTRPIQGKEIPKLPGFCTFYLLVIPLKLLQVKKKKKALILQSLRYREGGVQQTRDLKFVEGGKGVKRCGESCCLRMSGPGDS